MKYLKFVLYGIIFSIILIKVEAISWFRINEMFHFQSFHMYGVLLSGIAVAAVGIYFLRKTGKVTADKKPLQLQANILGGLSFGIGWGITGACTGPLYAIIGLQLWPALFVLSGAIMGTFVYALFKHRLPHTYEKRNKINKNATSAYS